MPLEVLFHEILKVWVIADNDLRELLVHPDGHVLQFDSKEAATFAKVMVEMDILKVAAREGGN